MSQPETFTIEQLNGLTKEQLKALGIKLQTRKEKTPEQLEATRRRDAFTASMETVKAQMPNATWVCMDDSHRKGDNLIRPGTYNLSPGYKHIIKENCKSVRLVSVDLFTKHGDSMYSRKHVTLAVAQDQLESTIKFENDRKAEKLMKELAKLTS